jgi:hypothetical protein
MEISETEQGKGNRNLRRRIFLTALCRFNCQLILMLENRSWFGFKKNSADGCVNSNWLVCFTTVEAMGLGFDISRSQFFIFKHKN